MQLKVGDTAPEFELSNADVNTVTLSSFKGKWIILYFYPKDNTPGCSLEGIEFSASKEDFHSLNATVLGISPDSCKSHKNFIQKKELTVELLSDPEKKALESYGVWQEKKNYGKIYMGVVRSTFVINPEGKIAYIWEKVRVKGHVDAVLSKLKELQ